MNKKVVITPRWYGPVPERNGKPLPKNQWARAGRVRKWTVRWRAPDGSRPRQTFVSKEEAEEFVRSKTADFETQGPQARARPKHVTLGEFVDKFLTLRTGPRGQRLSIGTLQEYRTILSRFTSFVGHETPLERIVMADATRYLASLRATPSKRNKPMSVSSVNKHKRNLRSAFNTAVQQFGYLQSNPFGGLKQDKVADKTKRYITPSEYKAIVAAAHEHTDQGLWWESFLAVSYTAGLRLNETTNLTWADIDFEENTIRVVAKDGVVDWRPKDYDSRTIPVPTYTVDLLGRMHAAAEMGSSYVFLSPVRVAWIKAKREAGTWSEGQDVLNNVNKSFKRLVRLAGADRATIHDLRRSALTNWSKRLSAAIVKELAGHADIKTTLRYYVSISQHDLDEAREVMAKALAE